MRERYDLQARSIYGGESQTKNGEGEGNGKRGEVVKKSKERRGGQTSALTPSKKFNWEKQSGRKKKK